MALLRREAVLEARDLRHVDASADRRLAGLGSKSLSSPDGSGLRHAS